MAKLDSGQMHQIIPVLLSVHLEFRTRNIDDMPAKSEFESVSMGLVKRVRTIDLSRRSHCLDEVPQFIADGV